LVHHYIGLILFNKLIQLISSSTQSERKLTHVMVKYPFTCFFYSSKSHVLCLAIT